MDAAQRLLRTGDTEVVDLGGALEFRRRGALLLGLGAGALLLGAAATAAPDLLVAWLGWALTPLGCLLIVLGALRALSSPIRLDAARRQLVRGALRIAFSDLKGVRLVETPIGRHVALSLTIEAPGGPLRLIDGQLAHHREALEEIARRAAALLDPDAAGPPKLAEGSSRGFRIALLLTLGALWAASGLLFAPDLAFTTPGGAWGVRAWPLGLWIAALGVLELLGARVFDAMVGPWTPRRRVLFALWMGSYLVVCATHVDR